MNKKTYLLFLIPIILALDLYAMSWVFEWLTKASNAFVVLGMVGGSLLLFVNYLLIRFTLILVKS